MKKLQALRDLRDSLPAGEQKAALRWAIELIETLQKEISK